MRDRCPICGGAVPTRPSGPPARYCSHACRRAAERDLLRLRRRVESLEAERDDLPRSHARALAGITGGHDVLRANHERAVAANERNLRAASAELADLLRRIQGKEL